MTRYGFGTFPAFGLPSVQKKPLLAVFWEFIFHTEPHSSNLPFSAQFLHPFWNLRFRYRQNCSNMSLPAPTLHVKAKTAPGFGYSFCSDHGSLQLFFCIFHLNPGF